MKFLVVIVGMFAIGNAAIVYRVAPIDPFVSSIAPAFVSAVVPNEVPETELADWEAYKVWRHFQNMLSLVISQKNDNFYC